MRNLRNNNNDNVQTRANLEDHSSDTKDYRALEEENFTNIV